MMTTASAVVDLSERTRHLEAVEIMQIGSGVPTHFAAEGIEYWDRDNDALYINNDGANGWTLIGGGAAATVPHNILSATHPDSTAATVSRGSLITGQDTAGTTTWQKLGLGPGNSVLMSDGVDASWRAPTSIWHGIVPIGGIILWSGSVASIPLNWQLCLTGDTEITLADGSQKPIAEIVDGKESVEVLSYDVEKQVYVVSKVTDWFKNPAQKEDWAKLKIGTRRNSDGKRSINITWEHPVWTQRGWINIKDLRKGDTVFRDSYTLTAAGKQAILGSYLGDGSISDSFVFRVVHSHTQADYINYFGDKLGFNVNEGISDKGYNKGNAIKILSGTISLQYIFPEIVQLRKSSIKATPEILKQLGAIGLAFWYMDDGHLCRDHRYPDYYRVQLHTEGMSEQELENIRQYFDSAFGIDIRIYDRNNTEGQTVRLDKEGSEVFCGLVAPYIVPSMRYKLPEKLRTIPFVLDSIEFIDSAIVSARPTVRAITDYSPSKRNRKKFDTRYDILVEGTHCFFANGFLVHNCDGTNGTPNLRDRFVVGAGTTYNPGDTGGAVSQDLTHTHGPGSLDTDNDTHDHSVDAGLTANDTHSHGPGTLETDDDTHTHTISGQSGVSGATYENIVAGAIAVPSTMHTHGAGTYANANDTHDHTVDAGITATDQHNHGPGTLDTDNDTHDHSVDAGVTDPALGVTSILPPYFALAFIQRMA